MKAGKAKTSKLKRLIGTEVWLERDRDRETERERQAKGMTGVSCDMLAP